MSKPIITVVGSFAVGLTIRTPHMPIFGETLRGSDFDMGPGGKGSNQAVGTARLGAESYFVGLVGEDKLADIGLDLYKAEGVNTSYLRRTAEKATGVGFIILNTQGENFIILDMAANTLMDAAFVDVAEEQIARSKVVMSVLEIPVEAAARAMELGKKHGVTTILNPAPAAALPDSIFQHIDILTPNESELRILMGLRPDDPTPTAELAAQLKARGVKTLVVTQGSKGAMLYDEGGVTAVPSIPVTVVDTTGAGDAFNSGLAVAVAMGKPLVEAVRYGCAAGAKACTTLGVIPSLGHREQIDNLYAQNYG
ncbi:MAG: ribokinase [Chloroflexi bacterium]|nr:ribokinase [Chloroflexota bacterium]